jgi:PTS system beta-glucosides-specific IIC component
MAGKDYSGFAKEIVSAVGGKENIASVQNCMTRLRFVLKDASIVDDNKVKGINGVKGIMNKGGQYQIVIGTHVDDVIAYVHAEIGEASDGLNEKPNMSVVKEGSILNRLVKVISGCVIPMIGVLVGSGILKGVLAILTTAGVLASTDGTYMLLYAASDAVFVFLPIIIGFSAGKVFNCNSFVTATIGAALLYPNISAVSEVGGSLTFLHIPVILASYSSTLLPIILAAWFASKVEKLSKKIIPQVLQLMFVPAVTLAVSVPVAYLVIGPLMNTVSGLLSTAVMTVFDVVPVLAGVILGAFWQLFVLLGLHSAFIPVLLNNIFTIGSDPINAILGLTIWALGGMALGYSLKIKNKDKKATGLGSVASCMCGISEPTIYSIALPNIKLFVCAFIGGGIGGGILAAMGGRMYNWVGDGLFRIPGMINPEGLDISFYGFLLTAAISFIVSGVLAFIVTKADADSVKR